MLNSEEQEHARESLLAMKKRQAASEGAYQSIQDQVSKTKDFSEELATELAIKYAAYCIEQNQQNSTIYSLQDEISGIDSETDDSAKSDREAAGEMEEALVDAQRGNFQKLKEAIKKDASGYILDDHDIEIQESLIRLADALPEKGKPIKLPIPAWMDPEFAEPETE